jgi:hypothetical protein
MVTINIEGLDRTIKRVDAMAQTIRHFKYVDVLHAVRDWEVDDVDRHRPGAKRFRTTTRTKFRPHSRFEMHRHMLAVRRLGRKGIVRPPSNRPILRAEMIDRLHERLTELIARKLKW